MRSLSRLQSPNEWTASCIEVSEFMLFLEWSFMSDSTRRRIEDIIASGDVILFMKGIPAAPQCGFSAAVVQILSQLAVPFKSVDVLSDLEVREGIKAFSNWPTIPQLYVKGEFVGGCDIVREMYQAGELATLLSSKGIEAAGI